MKPAGIVVKPRADLRTGKDASSRAKVYQTHDRDEVIALAETRAGGIVLVSRAIRDAQSNQVNS